MSNPIIITSSHYVSGSGNKFKYDFPTPVEFAPGSKVGLQSLSIYNSTFNISSKLGNNKFTIVWNADTTTTVNVTIPDGYYDGSDLNYYFQSQFVANNMYVTTNSGSNYVYFAEILANSVRYAFQINTYALPTAAQATTLGYTKPSGATWDYNSVATSPQIILSSGLGTLLGFAETLTFPSAGNLTTSNEFLSDGQPQISPINNYILTLNIVNSKHAKPNNIFYAVPIKVAFGNMIDIANSSMVYNSIAAGKYSSIICTICCEMMIDVKCIV